MQQRTDAQFDAITTVASKRVVWMDEGLERKHGFRWLFLLLRQDLFPNVAFRSVSLILSEHAPLQPDVCEAIEPTDGHSIRSAHGGRWARDGDVCFEQETRGTYLRHFNCHERRHSRFHTLITWSRLSQLSPVTCPPDIFGCLSALPLVSLPLIYSVPFLLVLGL